MQKTNKVMKMKVILAFIIAFSGLNIMAQDFPVYKIYTSEGEPVTYQAMIDELAKADVSFFGELHNNPVAHWLEYEVTASLFEIHGNDLVLGAEMFEADQQFILDEYLLGQIPGDKFEADARLWPNYTTDYKPLVSFAKKHALAFVASNIPRRYASMVFKGGFEVLSTLSEQAKQYVAPSPVDYDPELACYAGMMKMGGMGMPAHANANLPKAQAIKDATMAYFIHKAMSVNKRMIHYNGAYHSDNHEGILWYLKKLKPDYDLKTISTVTQADLSVLSEENKGIADFIVVVDEDLTGSY